MIGKFFHVAASNDKTFSENLTKAIDECQSEGLEPEVQYQATALMAGIYFSALVIGRSKE